MSDYVQQHHNLSNFTSEDSWVILSDIEQSIKRKIESAGTPLKEWDINIYRGILTGFNDAFVISTEKRDEILASCKTDDERERSASIIRPILRGRDIKRYGHDWSNLWLINTHNGVKGQIPRINIEDYPAIKAHLDMFWEKIKKRADKGDTPYNLRNCAYLEDFDKPKIIFQEIVQESQFMLDTNTHYMCNDTCRIIVGKHLDFLLRILNSELFFYSVKTFYGGGGLGDHGVRMKHTFFGSFPSIPYDKELEEAADQSVIESLVYTRYGLSPEEIQHIRESL